MKNIIIFSAVILAIGCCSSAQAQQQTATLRPDGTVSRSSSATASVSGSSESAAIATVASGKKQLIKHEAVKLADGTEQIRVTDLEGKVTVISALPGESVQQKYWDYLKKEGLPCACSNDSQSTVSTPVV